MLSRTLAFDIEATGLDPHNDRILELAILRAEDGYPVFHERFHPGVPIPPPATAVHGITDADVAHKDPFTVHAGAVQRIVDGAVLLGYGCRRFDTVLLDEELRRAGEPGLDFTRLQEIDLLRVWAEKERRTLELAVQRFLGHSHDSPHDALADAQILVPLVAAMKRTWGLEDLDLVEITRPPGEVDRSGRLRLDTAGEVVFNFGQHRGERVGDHPDYVEWMLQSGFPPDTEAVLLRLKEKGWRLTGD